jgi:hypothetical protein
MPSLTLTDFRRMDPKKPDNDRRQEHLLNSSERSFPAFTSQGFLETEQKLKPKDGWIAPPLGSNGLPERRIGRWNYTIVPWED